MSSARQASRDFCRSHNANTWEIPYTSQCKAAGSLTNNLPTLKPLLPTNGTSEKSSKAPRRKRCTLIMTKARSLVAVQHIFASVSRKTSELRGDEYGMNRYCHRHEYRHDRYAQIRGKI